MISRDSELDPQQVLRLADRLFDEGRLDELDALVRKAMERLGNYPEICLRAAIVVQDNDPDLSRHWARQAADLDKTDPSTQFRAARVLFGADDVQGASTLVQRAAQLADEDFVLMPELLHLMGRIAAILGENDELAERALREAFEAAPEELEHGQILAVFLADRGKFKAAMKVVAEASDHHPDDSYLDELRSFLEAHRHDADDIGRRFGPRARLPRRRRYR